MAKTQARWRGERAEKARNGLGLSPTQVAAHVGVTADTLRRWERGDSCPNAVNFAALASVLKVSLHHLLGLPDKVPA